MRKGSHGWLMLASIVFTGLQTSSAFAVARDADSIVVTYPAIAVTVFHGHAIATVEAHLSNREKMTASGSIAIALPELSAATGLCLSERSQGRLVRREGELLAAHEAEREYEHSSVSTPFGTRALLSEWSWRQAGLDITPVFPGETKVVEFELTLATRYHDGVEDLTLPDFGPSRLTVRAADAKDWLSVNGRRIAQGGSVAVAPGPESPITIELHRARLGPLGGHLAVHRLNANTSLVHYQIETPPAFEDVPRRPAIVVLLDESRSMDPDSHSAGAVAMAHVLSRMPSGRIAILAFSRRVRPITHGFVSARAAIAALRAMTPAADNGSAVDEALSAADTLLARKPVAQQRRVYLLSDLVTRSALDPTTLARALSRSRAVLHIGVFSPGPPALKPDDTPPWSQVARATSGLLWQASAGAVTREPALAKVFEEWVRPIHLYNFRMTAVELEATIGTSAPEDPDDAPPYVVPGEPADFPPIRAGVGWGELGVSRTPVGDLHLQGELWSRKVTAVLTPDASLSRPWSALAVSAGFEAELSVEERLALARHGRAVSDLTSYLVRGTPLDLPATESRYGFAGIGLSGTGSCYHSCDNESSSGRARERTFEYRSFLEEEMRKARDKCGGSRARATITVETTVDEIVDVVAVTTASSALTACLREAIWRISLPEDYAHFERQTWVVALT